MAFYQGVDLDRYNTGEKFLPMDRFLGAYTPPSVEEETVTESFGIPAAAQSYKGYPSYADWLAAQGGTGDGGGGPDDDDEDGYAGLGLSPGALGGKVPGFGGWKDRTIGEITHGFNSFPSITGIALDAFRGIGNKIAGWQNRRAAKKEKDLIDEIEAYNLKSAQDIGATTVNPSHHFEQGGGGYQDTPTHDAPKGHSPPSDTGHMGPGGVHYVQGGRVYLNLGGLAGLL
jgi:hypothetical protein